MADKFKVLILIVAYEAEKTIENATSSTISEFVSNALDCNNTIKHTPPSPYTSKELLKYTGDSKGGIPGIPKPISTN